MTTYRVCVAGGYRLNPRVGKGGNPAYEAEAIVYTFGGRVVARFRVGRYSPLSEQGKRDHVEAQARAWITEHAA